MRNASEMTPAELANVNGHFDLANKLHSLHVDLYKYLSSSIGGGQVKQHVYDYVTTPKSNYQIPPPPRPVHQQQSGSEHLETYHATSHGTKWNLPNNNSKNDDPFGTLRAAKKISPSPEDSDDEVFIQNDKFGTLKANKMMQDYRETSSKNTSCEELAITDEFLKLLDDLQSKNYSAKEMENLFENWKRKADLKVNNTKDKTKKQRTTNLILKLFKNHGLTHSQSDPYIKATKDTKTYRKPSLKSADCSKKPEIVEKSEDFQDVPDQGPMPIMENQSVIEEGEITIINAEDLELMEQNQDRTKTSCQESSNEGISTQILPLSRLSLSSNSSPPEPITASKKDLRPIGNVLTLFKNYSKCRI